MADPSEKLPRHFSLPLGRGTRTAWWCRPRSSTEWVRSMRRRDVGAGPISSDYSAEFLALVHGLEWCHSHLKTCHFQSALSRTDSQSVIAFHSTAPSPTKVLGYLDPLRRPFLPCSSKLPVGPDHVRFCGTELADSLAKTGATLPFAHVPSLLASDIAKIAIPAILIGDEIFLTTLFFQIPSVSS